MRIIAVDDEELALEGLAKVIVSVVPDAEIHLFMKCPQALAYAKEVPCDIAFLDIKMRQKNGILMAKELKDINPRINIIFVTGYAEYALDAFAVSASGYMLKPVTRAALESELENLRYPIIDKRVNCKLYVQCFGNFEVFSSGLTLPFTRTKTKELLAYLIYRRGAWCSVREIAAALWEDKEDTEGRQGQLRVLVTDLLRTLQSVGMDHIVIKQRGMLRVSTTGYQCDYYEFMYGDVGAINRYTGEFMSQYSWAEFINGYLDHSAQ